MMAVMVTVMKMIRECWKHYSPSFSKRESLLLPVVGGDGKVGKDGKVVGGDGKGRFSTWSSNDLLSSVSEPR